jgi:AraC-like DNA-binding protein
MLFMLKGELLINSEEYPGNTLHEKQFILQAIGSKIEILALTNVEYIIFWFNELPLLCEDRYNEIKDQAEAPLTYTPLVMSERIHSLISSMPDFLNEESPCSKYIELKCKELVFLITNFYPLPQLKTFFYPISTYTESFQYFVIQNYSKVKSVEEFAHLGGYTTTTFRRLFKNMYGIPVYEWILEKKREGILDDLQHTNMRITEICNRYGFDSLSHFAHFCKDSFGDTPRALRKKAANGEKIGKISD